MSSGAHSRDPLALRNGEDRRRCRFLKALPGLFLLRRELDRIHSNSGNNLCPTIDYDGNIGRPYSGV